MELAAKQNGSDDHWSIGKLLRPVEVPEEYEGEIRAKQLDAVSRLTAVIVLANLINASVVMMSFWDTGASKLLSIWGLTICVMSGAFLFSNMRGKRLPKQETRSREEIERYGRNTCLLGFVWAILPVITIPFTDTFGQTAIGMIMMGILFGGALLISRIPEAALGFVLPIAAGVIVGLQIEQDPRNDFLSILTMVYVAVLWIAVRWSHRLFVEQHLGEAAVAEQTQLISLLLRDFEETTSDWLWQTDERGVLAEVPLPALADKLEYALMAHGVPLLDMFDDCEAKQVLSTSMRRHTPFRDLVLEITTDDGTHWWSITGKPIFEMGEFAGFRGVVSDVTQSKEIEDRMAYMAHYDALTGLPNRVTLMEHLERHLAVRHGQDGVHVLVWLDLDNFKWVNDTLGHPAGDELLRQVAERINSVSRPEDLISRLGGDEFALVVRRDMQRDVTEYVDTLSNTLGEVYEIWGSTVHCGASIGVRTITGAGVDTETLLKHADLALYQAKSMGKGTWCFFTPELDERARARRAIESDLHRALERSELRLHFQPLISAQTREVVACETLLRWQHPERGLVMPIEFIEHAEDSGLITRLGDWVIRAALEAARRMPDHVRVAVNVSPLQIHSSNLVSTVVNSLAQNNIAPNRLELEITESVLMTDTEFTLSRLKQLKDIGLRIALDDFGTGFSSLSYLRRFPFDKLKIDKSFIQDLELSDDCQSITRATLTLAKALRMGCTAEGVETETQSQFLTENGCDELQGYLISRPQPLDKLGHLMEVKTEAEVLAREKSRETSELIDFNTHKRVAS